MIVGLIDSILFCLIVLLCEVGLVYVTYRACKSAIAAKKAAEAYAKKIKTQTDMQYNKYAGLSFSELEAVLQSIYSEQLSIVSAQLVSTNDPNARDVLYAKSLEAMLAYLGPETLDALDYYYGKNFITRWCETKYFLLENDAVISSVIDKSIRAMQIRKALE